MAQPVLHVVRLMNTDMTHYDEHFAAHIAWATEHANAGEFLFAGSLFENRQAGGMIVARTESRAALDRILRDDPFLVHGVAVHEVMSFNVSLGCNAHTLG